MGSGDQGHRDQAPVNDIASLFRGCATSHISDTLGRLPGTTHLRPMHRSGALLGLALTVRVRSGDTLIIHKALQHLQPGQVLVIDGDGDSRRALVGEIMKRVAPRLAAALASSSMVRSATSTHSQRMTSPVLLVP